jgi:hypothetical protein
VISQSRFSKVITILSLFDSKYVIVVTKILFFTRLRLLQKLQASTKCLLLASFARSRSSACSRCLVRVLVELIFCLVLMVRAMRQLLGLYTATLRKDYHLLQLSKVKPVAKDFQWHRSL